jgi:hypothetical protein
MHLCACTRPRALAPTHTHARTRTHTDRQTCNIPCFSTATVIRERASLLRYTYIACLIFNLNNYIRHECPWRLLSEFNEILKCSYIASKCILKSRV